MGPNPTQGFLFNLKEGHFEDIEEQPNGNTALLNSVSILPKTVRSEQKIDWAKFRVYLDKNFRKNTSKARLSYAKSYCSVLLTGDARELMDLSFDKRIHAMKSLSAYPSSWDAMMNGRK